MSWIHISGKDNDVSSIINQVLEKYALEGLGMPYTMEHFKKDYLKEHVHELDKDSTKGEGYGF